MEEDRAFYAGWDAAMAWINGSGCTEEWEAKSAAYIEWRDM